MVFVGGVCHVYWVMSNSIHNIRTIGVKILLGNVEPLSLIPPALAANSALSNPDIRYTPTPTQNDTVNTYNPFYLTESDHLFHRTTRRPRSRRNMDHQKQDSL